MQIERRVREILDSEAEAIKAVSINASYAKAVEFIENCKGKIITTGMGKAGFVAHKFAARNYGCWAEFRADSGGLRFGIILAAAFGIVFMAPGAVMVAGNTTKSQFGKIALAGPVTNVVLWLSGLIVILLGLAQNSIVGTIIVPWMWGNAILGAFNMIPWGPLDGKKIKTWSHTIFYFWAIVCGSMVWFTLTELNGLIG